MLRESYPCYLANEPVTPNLDLEVLDKYTGEVATRVPLVGENLSNHLDIRIVTVVKQGRDHHAEYQINGFAIGGIEIHWLRQLDQCCGADS